jgi:NADH-quinone oxidoreductase subunit M
MPDLTRAERLALMPVIAVMFLVGLYPQVITGMVHSTVMQWVAGVRF